MIGNDLIQKYSRLIESFENIDQDVLYIKRFWENIESEAIQIFTALREKDKNILNK